MRRLIAAALLCWLGVIGLAAGGRSGGEPPVTALAFAPDGKELIAGSQAGIETRAWPVLGVLRRSDPPRGPEQPGPCVPHERIHRRRVAVLHERMQPG